MVHQLQHKNSDKRDEARLSFEFIVACIIAFVISASATVYFIISMGDEMEMPGGWKMSMMWMQMPNQSLLSSALIFLFMWLAMMVAMMMPSMLPVFLKMRRQWLSLCYMALGYFTIWLIAGLVIYMLGVQINSIAMHSVFFSRIIPLLSGASLIAAGAIQFTHWKIKHLSCCRSLFGSTTSCLYNEASFKLGCKQGIACCACCSSLMTTQLILGIMNPIVMLVVTIVITTEKLLPKPKVIARFAGVAAIAAGIIMTIHWVNT